MATDTSAPQIESSLASNEPRVFLVADISGYTRFLELVQESHPEMLSADGTVAPAYSVLASLLNVVMAQLAPSFSLIQVEGDALFAWAPESRFASAGEDLLVMARWTYRAFREQIQYAMDHYRHDCKACMVLPSLELKFVVHHGVATPQRIAGRELLASPAVNLVHRILKNSISEETGLRAYMFVTDAAVQSLGLTGLAAGRHTENYPDAGLVSGLVFPLQLSGEHLQLSK